MKFKLILIILLAAVLRFYQLGQVPSGFVNDEAAFGYNAYSLLKTGRDEFGERFPIIFQSFGEGKLPVYVYLTMPSVAIFGLNEFAVRLPSALFGTLTIWLIYLLVKPGKQTSSWPLLSALVLAVMPWHIHFSRAAFEANVAVFFVALATVFWQRKKYGFSLVAFVAALLTYNAARLFVPLWLMWLVFNNRRQFKYLLIFLVFWLGLFLLPQSRQRLANITIFHQQSGVMQRLGQKFSETTGQPMAVVRLLHNKPVEFTWDFIRRYTTHFGSDFLFFSGDPNRPRYRVPDTGQLLWLEIPLLIIGVYQLARRRQWSWLVWLVLAPLPAALTFETPSAIRSILMVVPLAIAIGLGASVVLAKAGKLWPVLMLLFIYNFSQYLDAYFIHAPVHQPYEWQGGYKELVKRVNELMPGYDRADITDSRGTAYIYFLFYNAYDPAKWQETAKAAVTSPDRFGFSTIDHLENLYFIGERCPAKYPENGVLYVCNIAIEEDWPESGFTAFKDSINFDDGQAAFVLFEATKAEAATLPTPVQ